MDEVALVVTALAAGAAAVVKPTAEQAVKDAYAAIKDLIKERYGKADSALVESDLVSSDQRDLIAKHLKAIGATSDEEIQRQALNLITLVSKYEPAIGREVGVDLEGIEAGSLRIQNVIATGGGVKIKGSKFKDSIDISEIQAGTRGVEPDP